MTLLMAVLIIAVSMMFGVGNYCSSDAILIAGAIILASGLASNE